MLSHVRRVQLHDVAACDHHLSLTFLTGQRHASSAVRTLAFFIVACSAPVGDSLMFPLQDSGDVRKAIAGRGVSVLLVYSPDECFTCSSDLAHWMELRRRSVAAVAVILTRSPDSLESRMLKRMRIPVAGVLRSANGGHRTRNPGAYVFNNGRLVTRVVGASLDERLKALAAAESAAASAVPAK